MEMNYFHENQFCRNLASDLAHLRKEAEKMALLQKNHENEKRDAINDAAVDKWLYGKDMDKDVGNGSNRETMERIDSVAGMDGEELERREFGEKECGVMESSQAVEMGDGDVTSVDGVMEGKLRRGDGVMKSGNGEMEPEMPNGMEEVIVESSQAVEMGDGVGRVVDGEIEKERQHGIVDGVMGVENGGMRSANEAVMEGKDLEDLDGEASVSGECELMDTSQLSRRLRWLEQCYDMLESRVQQNENHFVKLGNARVSQRKIGKEEMLSCMKDAIATLGTEKYGISRNQMKKYVGDSFGIELGKSNYYSKKFSALLKRGIAEKLFHHDVSHGLYTLM